MTEKYTPQMAYVPLSDSDKEIPVNSEGVAMPGNYPVYVERITTAKAEAEALAVGKTVVELVDYKALLSGLLDNHEYWAKEREAEAEAKAIKAAEESARARRVAGGELVVRITARMDRSGATTLELLTLNAQLKDIKADIEGGSFYLATGKLQDAELAAAVPNSLVDVYNYAISEINQLIVEHY